MRPQVKYHVIHMNRDRYSICAMCRFFGVSRSGYYDFVHRLGHPEKDTDLADIIREQQKHCYRTYGYRRMWLWLKKRGIHHNPKTILRIMRKYDLLAEIRRFVLSAQSGAVQNGIGGIFISFSGTPAVC